MHHKNFIFLSFLSLFFCLGCAPSLKNQRKYIVEKDTVVSVANYISPASEIQIQYLGCGGLLIKKQGAKILVDPFFSNPGPFLSFLWRKLTPDTATIDKAIAMLDLQGVQHVLLTHGHYDHIMDLPYIYRKYLNAPEILCNETSAWILRDQGADTGKLTDVYDFALGEDKPGKWIYYADSTYRILPVVSRHAPHLRLFGIELHLYSGKYNDLPNGETRTGYYKKGSNLSYLIDFLDDDKKTVLNRVQVLTGGASSRSATLIANLPEAHKVNVLALTVGLHNNEPDYPEKILIELDPDFVIAAHWEDFFQPYFSEKKRGVRMTKHRSFAKKMNQYLEGRWIQPMPLTSVSFGTINVTGKGK